MTEVPADLKLVMHFRNRAEKKYSNDIEDMYVFAASDGRFFIGRNKEGLDVREISREDFLQLRRAAQYERGRG